MFRRDGGPGRLTFRRLHLLIEQLPPESRTKTAIRDLQNPFALAEAAQLGGQRGWGPISRTDDLLMRLGERIDWVAYVVNKTAGGTPREPLPWRRPGVLGPAELETLSLLIAAPVIGQLEQERAAREAARRAEQSTNE